MPSDYLETSLSLSITFNELHLVVKHTLQSVSNTMTVTSAINIENFGADLVRAMKASTGAPRVFCWKGSGPAQSQCVFPVVTLRRGSQVPWGWTLAWGGTFSWGSHLGPVRAPAKAPSPWSHVPGHGPCWPTTICGPTSQPEDPGRYPMSCPGAAFTTKTSLWIQPKPQTLKTKKSDLGLILPN